MRQRVLLVVCENDEAFLADFYEPTISKQTSNGDYHLIANETHLGVVDNADTPELIGSWMEKHFPR